MPFVTGLNVHPSVPCYPGTARRQGLSGEKEGSILLFGAVWVFFGDVFGLVNQIIIKLTQGCKTSESAASHSPGVWADYCKPDFARPIIHYVPDRSLVELKSLKYYLTSYRNVGVLQEHAVNRILKDLVQLLHPVSMEVESEYKERGGTKTKAVARYDKR